MKSHSIMLIAGEASGDTLAAELVVELRRELLTRHGADSTDMQPLRTKLGPRFFGAGGSRMAAAGVELAFDMTQHSVIGLSEALKQVLKFRRLMNQLLKLAIQRQPDVIICVDFHGFNGRFTSAVRRTLRSQRGAFHNWNPKIIQFVSPQVWASRPGRAGAMAENLDLLLTIFPFEKDWYAQRVPKLRVEFVGNPMIGRFSNNDRLPMNRQAGRPDLSGSSPKFSGALPTEVGVPVSKFMGWTREALVGEILSSSDAEKDGPRAFETTTRNPQILLLPGSRADEVRRHLPLIAETAKRISQIMPAEFIAISPNESMAEDVRAGLQSLGESCRVQVGDITEALRTADLAISKTGTVLMECAMFGVPAVSFYKTSWLTYLIAKQLVKVKWLSMPNILANEELFPEFVQDAATPENLSGAALDLLNTPVRRAAVQTKLKQIIAMLGNPGAIHKAAKLVSDIL